MKTNQWVARFFLLAYSQLIALQVSNRLLMSFTLSRLPSDALPTTLLPNFLTVLNRELSVVPSRIAAYTSGLQLIQPLSPSSYKEVLSLAHIENCLRLLDSLLLQRWEDDEDEPNEGSKYGRKTQRALDKAKQDGLGESLIGLCLVTEILRRQPNAREQRDTGKAIIVCYASSFSRHSTSREVYSVCHSCAHQSESR